MRRLFVIALTAAAAILVGIAVQLAGLEADDRLSADARVGAGSPVSVAPYSSRLLKVKPETKKRLGEFKLRGRKLRLETAESVDGDQCIIHAEGETGVSGSQCFKNGLFGSSRAAFSLNFDGGPDRFSSMYVVGVAAPSTGRVEVVKTDRSVAVAQLTDDRAFVVESPAAELERGVVPASVRVYGRNGRHMETIDIPAPR